MTLTATPPLDRADAEYFGAARLRAARLQPYLASAVFSLVPVLRPGFGTFAVDQWWRVYLDMDVARDWGVEATAAVLLHEAHHVVRDHHRRAERAGVRPIQSQLWNLAGDAAINDDLLDDGLALPDPVLPHHLGLEPGLLEEAYFRHLAATARTGERATCGSGSGGVPSSVELDQEPGARGGTGGPSSGVADGVDEVDAGAIRRSVAHDVVRAAAQDQGVSPGLLRWAEQLLVPQVPWRTLLRAELGRSVRAVTARTRPDWARPDRRADSRPDFPRPGARHHRPQVAVVIDTSASMSCEHLDAATTEIDGLLHRGGVAELTVVVCDAAAVRPQRVRRVGQVVLRGGGGTDLRVGISAAAALRPAPSVIVVLTDGWTPWPDGAPDRSALVAIVIGEGAPLPTGRGITAVRIAEPS